MSLPKGAAGTYPDLALNYYKLKHENANSPQFSCRLNDQWQLLREKLSDDILAGAPSLKGNQQCLVMLE